MPAPDHDVLGVGLEAETPEKGLLVGGEEPEAFHAAEPGVLKDSPHQAAAHADALVVGVHDHVPEHGAVGEIRADAGETDQLLAVPGRGEQVAVLEHGPYALRLAFGGPPRLGIKTFQRLDRGFTADADAHLRVRL